MKKKRWRVFLAGMSLIFALQMMIMPLTAEASSVSDKTVRVGYYMLDGFQMMDEDGNKSGYGYDFLRETTRYIDVDYEYVGYDEYSFGAMMNQLKAEEIDVLVGVIDRPSRRHDFLYSEPMGTRVGTMFMEAGNTEIVSGDYSTYDGMKVGVLANSSLVPELADLAAEKGFTCQVAYYENFEKLNDALKQGEVDTILTCLRFDTSDKKVVERLDSKAYYAIVKKGNQELLDKINYAIAQMDAIDGNWKNALDTKYYTHYDNRNITFTEQELQIIEKYREGGQTLKVACSADRMPYSYEEDGQMQGIIPDYFKELADYVGLSYEMMIPKSRAEYAKWQQEKTADIFIDMCVDDENEVERQNSASTIPYITMRLAQLTRKDFRGEIQTVAVAQGQGADNFEKFNDSKYDLITVDNSKQAIDDVLAGNVDAAVMYLYTAQEYLNSDGNGILAYTILEQPTYRYSMVVTDSVEQQLAGILTKCIYATPDGKFEELAEEYTRYKVEKLDFWTWIRLYPGLLLLGGVIIFAFCFMAAILIERYVILGRERKKTRELSALNEEISAESRAKSSFFANMSHDIRTPMNVIMGIIELMEHETGLTADMRKKLGKMKVSGDYLLSIVNNILDMSMIEAGEVTLVTESICVTEQMSQIDDIIRPKSDARGHVLTIDAENLEHDYVLCDSVRLKQILVNLLSNAIKYTPNGGKILLKVRELVSEKEDYARYVFTIADNGNGMSEEYIRHVYEPFSRSKNALLNKERGSGLGLPITKSFVDLLGGEIQVESKIGKGTTFQVFLDMKIDSDTKGVVMEDRQSLEEKMTSSTDNQSVLEGRHFLCAEDNALNTDILRELLNLKGATCTVYEDGAQLVKAFAKVKPGEYDAILMDIQMPNMNGYEAARKIREGKNPLGKEIPIIAMSANAFAEDIHQSMVAGMDAHISKPIDIARMEACIKQLLLHDPGNFGEGRCDKR